MNVNKFKRDLLKALSNKAPKRITEGESACTHSSVLLPLFIRNNQYWLLFMKRANTVEHHKGEVSFPGGAQEENDKDFEYTAKREAFEEIGVAWKDIVILGQLDDVQTMTSNFIIHPFLGTVPFPYPFNINKKEVDHLIEIPLKFFLDPSQPRPFTITYRGDSFETPAFIYNEVIIWGATERILENLIRLIRIHNILV